VLGYAGLAMFTFEGTAVVLNLRHEAKKAVRYPKYLTMAVVSVTLIFIILGVTCYMTFRSGTQDILTLNLLPETTFTFLLKLFIVYNVFASYPIQALCLFDLVEQGPFFKGENALVKKIPVRISIILFITWVTTVIPNLISFLDLAGAIGASVICFVLPPVFYMNVYSRQLSKTHEVLCYLILMFGISGGLYSIYNSLAHWE